MIRIFIFTLISLLFLSSNAFANALENNGFGFTKPLANDTVTVYLTNTTIECTKTQAFPVRVKGFTGLTNLQFSINFDKTVIAFDSIAKINAGFPPNAVSVQNAGNGNLSFSWAGAATSLSDGTALFLIYFHPKEYGTNLGTSLVQITSVPTTIKAASTMSLPVKIQNSTIQITDKTPPTLVCPPSKYYHATDSLFISNNELSASVLDDCGTATVTKFVSTGATKKTGASNANSQWFKRGVSNVVYTATDMAGNTAVCPFQVIITKPSDDTVSLFMSSKMIKCEETGYIEIDVYGSNLKNLTSLQFSINWNIQGMADNGIYNPNPALQLTSTNFNITSGRLGFLWSSGTSATLPDGARLFSIRFLPTGRAGVYPVGFGNVPTTIEASTTASFPNGVPVKTILGGGLTIKDEIAPTLQCPPDLVQYTPLAGATSMVVVSSLINPTRTENCGLDKMNYLLTGATSANALTFNPNNTAITFNVGTTNVLFNATDFGGNLATCSMNVTVNNLAYTVERDTISCSETQAKINIRVKDFEKIKDFRFSVQWSNGVTLNTSKTMIPTLNGVTQTGNVSAGARTFTWNSAQGVTLPDDAILMTLYFDLVSFVAIGTQFQIGIQHDSTHAIGNLYNILPKITTGSILVSDNNKPTPSNCPSDIAKIVTSCSPVSVTWVAPVFTDDCGPVKSVKVTKQQGTKFPANTPVAPGDNFDLGVTTVTYAAEDNYGNIANCVFTVTVKESTPPTITCPLDIVKNNDQGMCGAKVVFGLPFLQGSNPSDNCTSVTDLLINTSISPKGSDEFFPVGTQILTYKVTDASTNTATCTFKITVKDTEKPIFNPNDFPAPAILNVMPDSCGVSYTWDPPTATDNCTPSNQIKIIASKPSGSFFPVGLNKVYFQAEDLVGNKMVDSITLLVLDNQPPKFVACPKDTVLLALPNVCGRFFAPPTLQTKDNCKGIANVTASNTPPNNLFPIGTTTLLYKDPNAPSVTCSFKVTIKGVDAPKFTCPKDTILYTTNNSCGVNFTAPTPIATAACTGKSILANNDHPSSFFQVGETEVVFIAADEYGLTATCTMKVKVSDKTPPKIKNCPFDIFISAPQGAKGEIITWTAPTSKDSCSAPVSLTSVPANSTFFSIGKTTVIYTAMDANGNTATCSFVVTVTDNQSPIINCPPNGAITVPADTLTCGATIPLPTMTDNSGKPPTIVTKTGVQPNDFYLAGIYNISLIVKDSTGNQATCNYVITVKDKDKPTITAPADITISTLPNSCFGQLSMPQPSVADGCNTIKPTVKITPTMTDFPLGTTILTFTATDTDGNTATATMKVTVLDQSKPFYTGCPPSPYILPTDSSKVTAKGQWVVPSANDNCSLISSVANINPGGVFVLGAPPVKIIYTATDASGLTATCAFDVVVKDLEKPTIACKDTFIVANTPALCEGVFMPPVALDNDKVLNLEYSPSISGNNIYPVGTNQQIFMKATDVSGNTQFCSFRLIVKDTEKPKILTKPTDVTINPKTNECEVYYPFPKPTFLDNCDQGNIQVIFNRDSIPNAKGNYFAPGTKTQVRWYAKDSGGNMLTDTFLVVITGSVKPEITCPNDIVLTTTLACDTTATWATPTAMKGCAGIVLGSLKSDFTSGSTFMGANKVTYTVKDSLGREGSCSFNVTVKESIAPKFDVATFPKDVEIATDSISCLTTYFWDKPTATDNCSNLTDVTIKQVKGVPSGTPMLAGTQTITYRATDKVGNFLEKSFTITVKDKTKPKFDFCPKDVTVTATGEIVKDPSNHITLPINKAPDCSSVFLTFKKLTASDNCSAVDITTDPALVKFPVGKTTPYIYTATDAAGNTAQCSFNVTITRMEAPIVWAGSGGSNSIIAPVCQGTSVQLQTDSVINMQYFWSGPAGFKSQLAKPYLVNVKPNFAGDYTLKLVQNGCESDPSKPVTITVLGEPTTQTDVYDTDANQKIEGNVVLNDGMPANTNYVVTQLQGTTNGVLELTADGKFIYTPRKNFIGQDNFAYQLCYEDCPSSCSQPTVVMININQVSTECKVPNILTPNGDNFNEELYIDCATANSSSTKSELYIFNEWGAEVYRAIPYDNSKAWKGTFNNNPVPDGTYYFIYIEDAGKTPKKGFITVFR